MINDLGFIEDLNLKDSVGRIALIYFFLMPR